jgi:lipoprotein
MKKYLILLLFAFLLSCSASVPEKTDISAFNRQCANKAPFSSYVSSEKIYWSFFNDADKQCYYLGFL